jgi:hypothetical protein
VDLGAAGLRYPRETALFPSRDQLVAYLENYAERNRLDVRLGVRVDRLSNPSLRQGQYRQVPFPERRSVTGRS